MKQLAPLVLLLLAPSLPAAQPPLIGYVDMQEVLDKSKMGQQAQEKLKEQFAGRQQEIAEEELSIRQAQQALARDQALMSKEELDKKTTEIKDRIQKLQQAAAKLRQDLIGEQTKLGNAVIEPAQAIIGAVARDRQVSAVFERSQSGFLYVDEGLDLTAEVVKRLDAQGQE